MACTHLHTSAKQSADIHRYIHTADKQTDRQTYIPIFVLVTLHRHGGGLGRRPLEIVKKTRSFPRASLYVYALFSGWWGPDKLVSHASLSYPHSSAVCRAQTSSCLTNMLKTIGGRLPRCMRPSPMKSTTCQRRQIISHSTVIANTMHGKQKWNSVVLIRTLASMSLVFAAGSERSSATLFSYIGAADECCKCHGEEPLRLHNVLSHRSAVV